MRGGEVEIGLVVKTNRRKAWKYVRCREDRGWRIGAKKKESHLD